MRRKPKQFFSFELLTYQSLNKALPSRKCSYKVPAKCKTCAFNEVNDWAPDEGFEDNLKFQEQLKSCIQEVSSLDTYSTKESMTFLNQQINYPNYLQPSPCMNISRYPKCGMYCTQQSL